MEQAKIIEDIQADLPGTIADRAAQFSRIIGKIACLITGIFRIGCSGIDLPQFIVYIGISCYCGTNIDSNGCGIDKLYMRNAFRLNRFHISR